MMRFNFKFIEYETIRCEFDNANFEYYTYRIKTKSGWATSYYCLSMLTRYMYRYIKTMLLLNGTERRWVPSSHVRDLYQMPNQQQRSISWNGQSSHVVEHKPSRSTSKIMEFSNYVIPYEMAELKWLEGELASVIIIEY